MGFGQYRFTPDMQDNVSMAQNGFDYIDNKHAAVKGEYIAFMFNSVPGLDHAKVQAKSNIGDDFAADGVYDISNPNNYIDMPGGVWVYGNFSEITPEYISANRWIAVRSEKTPMPLMANNKSINFGGYPTGDYVHFGQTDTLTPAVISDLDISDSDITVSLWVYWTGDDYEIMYSTGRTAETSGTVIKFNDSGGQDTGDLEFIHHNGTNYYTVLDYNICTPDEWHHLVLSYDHAPTPKLYIYIDGKQEGTSTTGTPNSRATGDPWIGRARWTGGPPHWFTGNIDEVSVWSKFFTEEEVQQHLCDFGYDSNSGVRPTDLRLRSDFSTDCKLWLRMGDGDTYPTLLDHSTNGNNATMEDMTVANIDDSRAA